MTNPGEPYVDPLSEGQPIPSVEIAEYVGVFPFGHYETRGMTAEELEICTGARSEDD